MQWLIWPQYLVEPQHIEGYFDGMWIVRPDVCRLVRIVFYSGLKASMTLKIIERSLTEERDIPAKAWKAGGVPLYDLKWPYVSLGVILIFIDLPLQLTYTS
jgi:hypothetical protein